MSEYFGGLRQGQVMAIAGHPNLAGDYVIVSQSCDLTQPKREYVQLAPLMAIQDVDVRRGALGQDNPRYPVVTTTPDELFADLAQIVSIPKDSVEGSATRAGAWSLGPDEARSFGIAVGRWFGRFAIPTDIQPWLSPIQDAIRDKYASPTSNLGRAMQRTAQIRVEASSWENCPTDLTVHVIVRAGEIPSLGEIEELVISHEADTTRTNALDEACSRLIRATNRMEKYSAWLAIADSLAAKCVPKGRRAKDEAVIGAVTGVVAELWSEDEFPLSHVHKSEALDIDFLSDPTPLPSAGT